MNSLFVPAVSNLLPDVLKSMVTIQWLMAVMAIFDKTACFYQVSRASLFFIHLHKRYNNAF